LVVLHRPEDAAVSNPLIDKDLAVAGGFAWGPYAARIWAARALAARTRGDVAGELAALDAAIGLGPWDPSLAELQAEARLLRDDRAGTLDTGSAPKLVDALIRRARAAPPALALDLLARARVVAPSDARAYLTAAEV